MVLDSLAPARRRLVLGLAALVTVAVVVVAAVVVLTRDEPVATADQAELGPVLLIPGYGGNTDSLQTLADQLETEGRAVEVVDAPGDGRGDLREQAENLAGAVDDALSASGSPTVDLVGYSAGGVVARWYVKELDGAASVRRVVTLASPHHGTDVARLGAEVGGSSCPEACRQLDPGSDLLTTLNAGDETPSGPLWAALWTEDDETVVPGSSGELDGAVSFAVQDVCPGLEVGHGDMPQTPATVLMALAELGPDDPAVPGPEVCGQELDG